MGIGRRKPWIAGGSVVLAATLWWLNGDRSLEEYATGYVLLTLSNILPSVAWYGLVADVTPTQHKMRVSSATSASGLLGNLAGALVGSVAGDSDHVVKTAVIVLLAFSAATTLAFVAEPAPPRSAPGLHVLDCIDPRVLWRIVVVDAMEPFRSNVGFRMVFLARFLFQMGVNTVTQFFQYALLDCILLPAHLSPTSAVSLALLPLLLISPLTSSLLSLPHLRHERKKVVYVSGAILVAVAGAMGWVETYPGAVGMASVFGAGYGMYVAVEFAMVLDVLGGRGVKVGGAQMGADSEYRTRAGSDLGGEDVEDDVDEEVVVSLVKPDTTDTSHATESDPPTGTGQPPGPASAAQTAAPSSYARDLSLWHSASVLPSIFATPVAGGLRDYFQNVGDAEGVKCLGYKAVWTTVVVYCVGGMVATRYIPNMK
ncbi:hypothetical protein HDU93_008626 [Gonapodya sp. JEL0774]|nr:hypothetical protein HDU93_008626 [Gonapodya sp. JEL0774]